MDSASGGTIRVMALHALAYCGEFDALQRRDGRGLPYEHKRERARRDAAKKAEDRLQIGAYALLLSAVPLSLSLSWILLASLRATRVLSFARRRGARARRDQACRSPHRTVRSDLVDPRCDRW